MLKVVAGIALLLLPPAVEAAPGESISASSVKLSASLDDFLRMRPDLETSITLKSGLEVGVTTLDPRALRLICQIVKVKSTGAVFFEFLFLFCLLLCSEISGHDIATSIRPPRYAFSFTSNPRLV